MTDINFTPPSSTEVQTLPKRVRLVRKPSATAALPTKTAQMSKLLARTRGATLSELGTATGWQPHSIRALLSGMRKRGLSVVKEPRKTGETAYRIEAVAVTRGHAVGAVEAIAASTEIA